jgi:hypothetical protein
MEKLIEFANPEAIQASQKMLKAISKLRKENADLKAKVDSQSE